MASTVLATTMSTLQVRFEPMNSHGRSSSSFCCSVGLRVVLRPSAGYAKQQRLPSARRSSRTSPSSGSYARRRDNLAEYLPRLLPILQERCQTHIRQRVPEKLLENLERHRANMHAHSCRLDNMQRAAQAGSQYLRGELIGAVDIHDFA